MGFKSGGDNKETLTIQAPDGEKSNLVLKSDVSCFIRLEADTDNDNADETQNPYIEFIQDGGFTDFTIGLNKTRQVPGGGGDGDGPLGTISAGADNTFAIGSNLAHDVTNTANIQFYCRQTASVGWYDRGSTNHGPPDREGLRMGLGPIFNEARFPEGRFEIFSTEDSPVPSLYINNSASAEPALFIQAANASAKPIITITGSALNNGALLKAEVGSNGSAIALKVKTTAGSMASGATYLDVTGALPANAAVISISGRVTTGFDQHVTKIGVPLDAEFFVAADPTSNFASNVLKDDVVEQSGDTFIVPTQVKSNGFIAGTSDQNIRITLNGASAQGAVRLAVYYYEITPPSS